ncbi:MAG TPA: GGDEF domain-containing protein [Anaeromyxobacteraceae bacterium]|nr:GGDEF domain-containing protein [Anaeromyxobacteraceae bacterium]
MARRRGGVEPPEQTFTTPPRRDDRAQKRPYLLVLSGPQFGELFELTPGREMTIGRRADADVHIHDDGVSRRHATIFPGEDDARLVDLSSANGTYVDGQRVEALVLKDGMRFQLGAHTTVKLVYSDDVEAEYQRKLAQGALLEPLTGLYNRRHFMERLSAELAAADRHRRALSVLLLDVDHFKQLNDERGHLAGDEALKMLGATLRAAVRKEDVVARFGGEEFVVLARETALAGAKTLAERIRRSVSRARASFDGREIALTVSVGVAVLSGQEGYEPGRSEQKVLGRADRALYRAKEGGRNAVAVADEEG